MAHFPCNSAELIYAFPHDASSPSLLWILEGQIQAEPVIKMIFVISPWAEQDAASDIYFTHAIQEVLQQITYPLFGRKRAAFDLSIVLAHLLHVTLLRLFAGNSNSASQCYANQLASKLRARSCKQFSCPVLMMWHIINDLLGPSASYTHDALLSLQWSDLKSQRPCEFLAHSVWLGRIMVSWVLASSL